jgi:hypothetical protein
MMISLESPYLQGASFSIQERMGRACYLQEKNESNYISQEGQDGLGPHNLPAFGGPKSETDPLLQVSCGI